MFYVAKSSISSSFGPLGSTDLLSFPNKAHVTPPNTKRQHNATTLFLSPLPMLLYDPTPAGLLEGWRGAEVGRRLLYQGVLRSGSVHFSFHPPSRRCAGETEHLRAELGVKIELICPGVWSRDMSSLFSQSHKCPPALFLPALSQWVRVKSLEIF